MLVFDLCFVFGLYCWLLFVFGWMCLGLVTWLVGWSVNSVGYN